MKIRNGFVSNSSSSSFMAVGIDRYSHDWKTLLNTIGVPAGFFDYENINESLVDVGCGIYKVKNSDIYLYGGCEFCFIGIEAESFFNKDMKLSEIKKKFQEIIKEKYDILIDFSKIKLTHDEVSTE